MWAFEKFPAKLSYTPEWEDASTYEVEVFGYLTLSGNPQKNETLVVFRNITYCAFTMVDKVSMLPVDEFEHHFKHYKLVEENG